MTLAAVATLATVSLGIAGDAIAQTQNWPTRPDSADRRLPAGGSTDIAGRLLAEALGKRLVSKPIN